MVRLLEAFARRWAAAAMAAEAQNAALASGQKDLAEKAAKLATQCATHRNAQKP